MIRIFLVSIYFSLLSINEIKGQAGPIAKGMALPDDTEHLLWNSAKEKVRISEYRGKLLLIDFWTTRCISCLESFPFLDSIQRVYEDKLQVVLVNHISGDSLSRFFKKRRKVFKPAIPMIYQDTLLSQLFPHDGVPYHVWISPEGKVLYMGHPKYTTGQNIEKAIIGESILVEAPVNKTYTENLFDTAFRELILSYSYLARWKEGLHPEGGRKKGSIILNSGALNVVQLYQQAWDGITGSKYNFFNRPGITELSGVPEIIYKKPTEGQREWKEKHWFIYQLSMPMDSKENAYEMMKNELDRCFSYRSWIQRKPVNCYVLTAREKDKINKLRTKGGAQIDTWDNSGLHSEKDDSVTLMHNQPFKLFVTRLKMAVEHSGGRPFESEISYEGFIDIEFNDSELSSIESIRKMLNRYDLELTEKPVRLNVLFIKPERNDNEKRRAEPLSFH